MDRENLNKYIGWEWNKLTKNTIEVEFYPYKIIICDIDEFNVEGYINHIIRCLLHDNKIVNFRLN